jgi:hypothetical protein
MDINACTLRTSTTTDVCASHSQARRRFHELNRAGVADQGEIFDCWGDRIERLTVTYVRSNQTV